MSTTPADRAALIAPVKAKSLDTKSIQKLSLSDETFTYENGKLVEYVLHASGVDDNTLEFKNPRAA